MLTQNVGVPQEIYVSGGILNSRRWTQMAADIFGTRMLCVKNLNASCAGAAVLAMHAAGVMDDVRAVSYTHLNVVEGRGKGRDVVGAYSLQELVDSLEPPRRVMMLIRAGSAVDEMLSKLTLLLEKGDIIIDGGNSNFRDTIRRTAPMEALGLRYVGCGVSGGEEGALRGPSPVSYTHLDVYKRQGW